MIITHSARSLLGFKEPNSAGSEYGPSNAFLFGDPNSTVYEYFSNQSSSGDQEVLFQYVQDVILNVKDHIITLKVNETTANSFILQPDPWIEHISTLLNVSSTRISFIPENIGDYHFVNIRIADYVESLIYLTNEKLIFALCISLFVLATIQLGMMFIGTPVFLRFIAYFQKYFLFPSSLW